MNFVRTRATTIDVPALVVYEAIRDIGRHPVWTYNDLTVRHVDGPVRGVGARYASQVRHAAFGRRKPIAGTIEVMHDEPPVQFVFVGADFGGRYEWTFDLTEADGRTTLRQTCKRLGAPFPVQLVQPIVWAVVGRRQVEGGLAKLKMLIETARAVPAPRTEVDVTDAQRVPR